MIVEVYIRSYAIKNVSQPLVLGISFKNQMFTSVLGPILRVENVP